MRKNLEKSKAQGMYPTPASLARRVVHDVFAKHEQVPSGLLEPSAGYGIFILEAWQYWKDNGASKSELRRLVQNTFAYENDKPTLDQLKLELSKWCRQQGVDAKPQLRDENFLLAVNKDSKSYPNGLVVLGNPPWDEFTTRKHDNVSNASVEKIRAEREIEKQHYGAKGCRNMYQAFMYALANLPLSKMTIGMVLPRQLLGDMNSSSIRQTLIQNGRLWVTVFRNGDEPEFFFEAVDNNFQIISLIYEQNSTPTRTQINIRRGFDSKYSTIVPIGEDLTIPCPVDNPSTETLRKLLQEMTFGSWSTKWDLTISRGKVLPEDPNYRNSNNGKTIKAYQTVSDPKKGKLVLNKILPNSRRKLKAALIGKGCQVSDSLLVVETPRSELFPYLLLMLNSKAVELTLRSLTSNINLNNFRLMSLPIPEPSQETLKRASKLFEECNAQKTNWDRASELLCEKVFAINSGDSTCLNTLFPNRIEDDSIALAA